MACPGCPEPSTAGRTLVTSEEILRQVRPCDVCIILDKDISEKDCSYCAVCEAWICRNDENDIVRRTRAFSAKLANKMAEKMKAMAARGKIQGDSIEIK